MSSLQPPLHETALFRFTVISPLLNVKLARGELRQRIKALAAQTYTQPGGVTVTVSEKTLENWYYRYRRLQLAGLTPKVREDKGHSKRLTPVQVAAIVQAKREQPRRSSQQIHTLLVAQQILPATVSVSTLYRCLRQHDISSRFTAQTANSELRAYEAAHANAIWYADVLHSPPVNLAGRQGKAYLVTIMDDATRLICHSAFYENETALSVEKALKQAVLKRGLCGKLVVDNGSGFKTHSLQGICARLGIHLVRCRPYHPCGKAKLERWHRRIREQLLEEMDWSSATTLAQLNQYVWAWISESYHQTPHAGLPERVTPYQRWQQELVHVRPLGALRSDIDSIFYHRYQRQVKKDGTVSLAGHLYEVPFECVGTALELIVDPEQEKVVGAVSVKGDKSYPVYPLDKKANVSRQRQKAVRTSPTTALSSNLADVVKARYINALTQPEETKS